MPPQQVVAWIMSAAVLGGGAGFVLTPWVQQLVTHRTGQTPDAYEARIARWINRRVVTGGAAGSAAVAALVDAPTIVRVTLIASAVLGWLLVCVDAAIHKLPNPLVALVAVILLAGLSLHSLVEPGAVVGTEPMLRAAMVAVAGFAAFAVLHTVKPAALGRGDIKLAGVCGFVLGWFDWNAPVVALWAAFIGAGIFAVGLLLTRRGTRSTMIAFGPWLIFGTAVAIAVS